MSSDVDWWARAIGGAGLALAGTNLLLAQAAGRWKRRHAAMAPLENSLKDLTTLVLNRQDPKILQSLFTGATAGAALADLDGAWAKVPDRAFRRRLKQLVVTLQAIRGGPQTAPGARGDEPLTAGQIESLRQAESLASKLQQRIHKAARKGGG